MTPSEAAEGAESMPVLRTLADKVNWLIDQAHPAGRGPYTNNEVADLIERRPASRSPTPRSGNYAMARRRIPRCA